METVEELRRREAAALEEARELARRAEAGDADAREELEAAAAFLLRARARGLEEAGLAGEGRDVAYAAIAEAARAERRERALERAAAGRGLLGAALSNAALEAAVLRGRERAAESRLEEEHLLELLELRAAGDERGWSRPSGWYQPARPEPPEAAERILERLEARA